MPRRSWWHIGLKPAGQMTVTLIAAAVVVCLAPAVPFLVVASRRGRIPAPQWARRGEPAPVGPGARL